MYKVLEVRECVLFHRHTIVVICENEETHKRERFEFYKGYEDKILKETHYFGYSGVYDLLIAGDRFKIEEPSAYEHYERVVFVTK